ncbi:hypothetical protein [Streptomyces sp. NPDC004250]|uniref:hypothetical protein n=1 Tax=Streptomyces sp. NPDC004250 TaxID=3364692 RepID=UPI003675F464
MSDGQTSPPRALTDHERARLDYARRELESARAEDLEDLDAAGLIFMVERLRGRLSEVLDLMDEIKRP